jgi:Ribonuclease G/E
MKGRVVLLDEIAGRGVAALMVDGALHDLFVDPPQDTPPAPETIFQAIVLRPLKGQGGVMADLGDGQTGYVRHAKGLTPGQKILVQVNATADLGKAVPVATRVLFKDRYVIATPDAPGINISRNIKDEPERDRLLEIAHEARTACGLDYGLILRSAAQDVADDALWDNIITCCEQARDVLARAATEPGPACLSPAPDAHMMAWRDWALPDPDEVITTPGCFEDHGVLDAVDAMLSPYMPLGGGAVAYVEPTRALVAVDVNTGADTSMAAGLKANLALAAALPRALRMRGLGGQIVLDIAPMPKRDRKRVEDAIKKAFRLDGADVIFAGWTPLGHIELRKKRDRFGLAQIWPQG